MIFNPFPASVFLVIATTCNTKSVEQLLQLVGRFGKMFNMCCPYCSNLGYIEINIRWTPFFIICAFTTASLGIKTL